MDTLEVLGDRFERQRPRLRRLAYRLLGSSPDADDAVQEAWLRLQRHGPTIENVDAWLTTTVGRIALNVLRSRRTHPQEPLQAVGPELRVEVVGEDPAEQVALADAVGVALLVVLDRLTPAERVAFVMHDVFAVPFDEVAALLGSTSPAVRKLASRARRRVQDAPRPDPDVRLQRRVVDAFFDAARTGRLADLADVLQADVVLRVDGVEVAAGARAVSSRASSFAAGAGRQVRPVLVNGAAGTVVLLDGRPVSVMAFTVVGGRVAAIDTTSDPACLARVPRLDLG